MNYRGDTFTRNYSAETDVGDYTFENGDKLRVAFVDNAGELSLEKEINLTAGDKSVDVVWSADDMAKLKIGDYIIEAELTTGYWRKTHQEKVTVKLDYIVGSE